MKILPRVRPNIPQKGLCPGQVRWVVPPPSSTVPAEPPRATRARPHASTSWHSSSLNSWLNRLRDALTADLVSSRTLTLGGPTVRDHRGRPVQRQRDHHLRVVRCASPPIGAVAGVERGQVHLLDRVEHEPGQMVLLEPLGQRRRHQEHLITLHSQEVVTHVHLQNPYLPRDSPETRPEGPEDAPRVYATRSSGSPG